MKEPMVNLTFRIEETKKVKFEKKAHKESSPSDVLRDLIDEYIGDKEPQKRG